MQRDRAPTHNCHSLSKVDYCMAAQLQIENLTKVYANGVRALDDVSFEVPRGAVLRGHRTERVGQVDTAALHQPAHRTDRAGRIVFDGVDVTAANDAELRRVRRRIGMVFQHFNLVHRSPVLTNVLAGRLGYINPVWSLINRFRRPDIDKAHAQLERVGLARQGGQSRRCAQRRAAAAGRHCPRADAGSGLILADEPVASLDPVLAHSIMHHLEEINQEDGVTVLCSLHFLDLVHAYADRVIALNDGKLMFDGPPHGNR